MSEGNVIPFPPRRGAVHPVLRPETARSPYEVALEALAYAEKAVRETTYPECLFREERLREIQAAQAVMRKHMGGET